jgi:Domain of unknown function (DUF4304)
VEKVTGLPDDALEKFKEFLTLVAPVLRTCGYSRRGQNFYTRRDGNFGVINFQKSKTSTNSKVTFTLNLGIYSQVLAKFYYKWKEGSPPTEPACHWRKRVGLLLPGKQDHWWVIDETTFLPSLVREFEDILPLAASEIESYITDEALRDFLLSTCCISGFRNSGELQDLSVLVKRHGPFGVLDSILADLRNSGVKYVIKGHIERLEGVESKL